MKVENEMAGYRIGILIFDAVEEMDFVGPWEVFQAAISESREHEVFTIAENNDPIACEKGMRVIPDKTFEEVSSLDVLLIPGGSGARREINNPVTVAWIRSVAPTCSWVASVCTGAFLLVDAGPGKGKRVTTHHRFIKALGERANAEIIEGKRFVCDGGVVSAAGVMSGIEMSLWLAEQLLGPEASAEARDYIAYDFPPRDSKSID